MKSSNTINNNSKPFYRILNYWKRVRKKITIRIRCKVEPNTHTRYTFRKKKKMNRKACSIANKITYKQRNSISVNHLLYYMHEKRYKNPSPRFNIVHKICAHSLRNNWQSPISIENLLIKSNTFWLSIGICV